MDESDEFYEEFESDPDDSIEGTYFKIEKSKGPVIEKRSTITKRVNENQVDLPVIFDDEEFSEMGSLGSFNERQNITKMNEFLVFPPNISLPILPKEIFIEISRYMILRDITSLSRTCKEIQLCVDSRENWIVLFQRDFRFLLKTDLGKGDEDTLMSISEKLFSKDFIPKLIYMDQYYKILSRVAFSQFYCDLDSDYGWSKETKAWNRFYFSGKYTEEKEVFLRTSSDFEGKLTKESEKIRGRVERKNIWDLRRRMLSKEKAKGGSGGDEQFHTMSIGSVESCFLWSGDFLDQKFAKKYGNYTC